MDFTLMIKITVTIGFVYWFGHMSNLLFVDMQEQKKSTTEALKLWIKALITTLFVIGVIVY